jgi:outer membrane protein OmpA-like peptidoglycan-associated protein
MNRRLLVLLAVGLGLGLAGEPGTSVMPVLRAGQGARAAALGESYISLSDDASALYWNPAGLGQLPDFLLGFSHHQWFAGINDEVVHVVLPGRFGVVGLGLAYSGEPDIEHWDEQNQPGDTFGTWNAVLNAGYGVTLLRDCQLGFGLKGFYQDLFEDDGFGGAGDVGLIGRPLPFLKLGIAARNLGLAWYGSTIQDLPSEVGIGAGYLSDRLNATVDVVYPFDTDLNVRAGVECLPAKELALRLGYRTGPQDIIALGWWNGFSAGLGVTVGALGIDYSLSPYGKLGFAHRFGLRTVVPRRGAGSLRIRVLDGQTMQPLWADITLSGVRDFDGQVDRQGELVVTRLRPGQLIIHTGRTGYLPRADTMLILGDREQSAVITLRPLKYGGIWGGIFDAGSRERIGGTIGYRGPVSGEQPVDPRIGTFTLKEVVVGTYLLTAAGPTDDYIAQSCTVYVEPGRLAERSFYLVRKRLAIVLEGIGFENGKAEILPQSAAALDRAGRILVENPEIVVELAGHTDPREIATAEYPSNWELSQARAEAVRRYLIDKFQLAEDRLIARGYADTQPIAPNDTDEGMAKNRRTEFRIIEQ